jgi:hypothetical protein
MVGWFDFLRIESDLALTFIESARALSNPENSAAALEEVSPFDLELLPETLRPWVLDLAERLQARTSEAVRLGID